MAIRIALAGNPNCGKTTMFNDLTGSNQYVGNWPGVTVEKKEGRLRGEEDVIIQDLPGIYSLSPYTLAAHKEIYNLAYSLKGIQNIVPFAKETFSIGMELPGTPENQAMWEYARKVGPEKFRQYFAEKIAEVAEEDKKPL